MLFNCPTCKKRFVSDAKAVNLICPYCGASFSDALAPRRAFDARSQVGSNPSVPTMSAPVYETPVYDKPNWDIPVPKEPETPTPPPIPEAETPTATPPPIPEVETQTLPPIPEPETVTPPPSTKLDENVLDVLCSDEYSIIPKVNHTKKECGYKLDEAVKAHADKEQKIIEERGLRPVFRRSQADQLPDQFFQGILDRQNEVIIPPRDYSLIGEFHNGLAKAKRKESKLFGFVDKIGNEVIPCTWKSAGDFSEYFAGVQDVVSGKCGYIDLTGKLVIPYVWADGWNFHEGYAKVKDDSGKIGAIDKDNNIVVPCVWAAMGDFSEGLAGVKDDNGRCGYVDATGKLVIPCTWGEAWTFQDNVAIVQDSSTKLLGFIDKSGKQLTPCRWKKIERFKDGLCKVSESNFLFSRDKWITIDKNGCVLM